MDEYQNTIIVYRSYNATYILKMTQTTRYLYLNQEADENVNKNANTKRYVF